MARRDRGRAARRELELRDVYFVRLIDGGVPTGPVKIGSTKDVLERVRKLEVTSPVPLTLVGVVRRGGVAFERELHQRLPPTAATESGSIRRSTCWRSLTS